MLALLELMLAEPDRSLGTEERAVLERAVRATYAAAGIRPADRTSYDRPAPLLRDLHAALAAEASALAASLALRLERYVNGALAGMFAGPTNVALDRSLVGFDLQRLEPELRPIGSQLITTYVWSAVRHDDGEHEKRAYAPPDALTSEVIMRNRRDSVLHEHSDGLIWIPGIIPPAPPQALSERPRRKDSLPAALHPEIRQRRAAGESLRALARVYGVSHETIRTIVGLQATTRA